MAEQAPSNDLSEQAPSKGKNLLEQSVYAAVLSVMNDKAALEEKEEKVDERVKTFIKDMYFEMKADSYKKLAEAATAAFHDDIEMVSSDYKEKSSEIKRKTGKKECVKFWTGVLETYKCMHWKGTVLRKKIDGLTGTLWTANQLFFDDGSDYTINETAFFKLDEQGKCIFFESTTQDFDAKQMSRSEYTFKQLDGGKLTVLDDEFNEKTFDLKGQEEKIKDIQKKAESGKRNKRDVYVVVVTVEKKNSAIDPDVYVSHAVLG